MKARFVTQKKASNVHAGSMHIAEVELWHDLMCLSIIRTIVTTRTCFSLHRTRVLDHSSHGRQPARIKKVTRFAVLKSCSFCSGHQFDDKLTMKHWKWCTDGDPLKGIHWTESAEGYTDTDAYSSTIFAILSFDETCIYRQRQVCWSRCWRDR